MANATASMAAMAASTSKSTLDSQIVTKTLDTVNKYGGSKKSGSGYSMSDTYNFSKDVLSSVYSNTGSIANFNA